MSAPSTQHRFNTGHELASRGAAGTNPPCSPPPLTLATRLNGRVCSIPMHGELGIYSSVHGAAELVHDTGGFDARLLQTTWFTVRIRLMGCADAVRAERRISALAGDLLQMGMDASPDGAPPGCIPGLRLRHRGDGRIDAELYIENADVPGRWCLEAAAHTIAMPLACMAECQSAPVIEVICTEVEQVRVCCRVDIGELAANCAERGQTPDAASLLIRSGIDELMRHFGADSHQPLLAAQHNDHLLEAATAAALALGLDPLRFELGARTHATRWGSCEPLAKWRRRERELLGQLQIPLEIDDWNARADARDFAAPDPNGRATSGHARSELFLQVASVALAASLSFLHRGLVEQSSTRRRRNLLPPPLLERSRDRPLRHQPSEKVSSDSGVHPAIGASHGALLSRTG